MCWLKSNIGKLVSSKYPVSWETYLNASQHFSLIYHHALYNCSLYINRLEKHIYIVQIKANVYEYHSTAEINKHEITITIQDGKVINIENMPNDIKITFIGVQHEHE